MHGDPTPFTHPRRPRVVRAIFDLDGTIALIDHRRHLAKEHWPSFERSCVTDTPNIPIIAVCNELWMMSWEIRVWSARSEKVRGYTEDWLSQFNVRYHELRMRPERDSRDDAVVKEEWLMATPRERWPTIVFDDRNKVVAMWRRHGITCAQVAPGDF